MANYFYVEDGAQKGPISEAELLKLATPETIIWTEGMPDWCPAKDVPQVMSAIMAQQMQGDSASAPMQQPTPQAYGAQMPTNNLQEPFINPETGLPVPTYKTMSIIMIILSVICCSPLGVIFASTALYKAGNIKKYFEKRFYSTAVSESNTIKRFNHIAMGILAVGILYIIVRVIA